MDCNGEQIRYAAQSFAELCHLFAEQLIKVVLTKKRENKMIKSLKIEKDRRTAFVIFKRNQPLNGMTSEKITKILI